VVLIDDVMTSGATLAAAAEAALAAGAREVCVLVLARVARET
jgi:predicted amidophosphoribosyltransferase